MIEIGPAPHIDLPAQEPPARRECDAPGDRLRATLERWERLDAPLPEALIRRGLVALRMDRDALGDVARPVRANCRETRIHESTHFAVDVLAWRSGRLGPIHEQVDSPRVLLVVAGTATEIHFDESPCGRLAPSLSRPVPMGTVSVARAGDIRAMGNLQAAGDDLIALLVTSPRDGACRPRSISETVFGDAASGD